MEHRVDPTGWSPPSEHDQCVDSNTELTVTDLADIVELLKRRLAWFGLHSVRIGPYVKVRNGSILIDLLDGDELFCRVTLDRRSGVMAFPSGSALRPLMASLHNDVSRAE